MKKRMLSLLLVLVMLVGMIPAITMPASAATQTVEVETWDALESALKSAETTSIKVTKDIKHKHTK